MQKTTQQETIKNLERNGFEVIELSSSKEALSRAKEFIKDGQKIGLGGSTTVSQIGLLEYLIKLDNIELYNQYEEGISKEENLERRRQGILSDLYITSCNAITKDGFLVNVDGDGNRVAAQIFGPKKVLLIVGKNKLVDTLEDGFKRVSEVAIPLNIDRMNSKAISMGKEPLYNPDNIANKFSYITGDREGRTTILLVDEELGF